MVHCQQFFTPNVFQSLLPQNRQKTSKFKLYLCFAMYVVQLNPFVHICSSNLQHAIYKTSA